MPAAEAQSGARIPKIGILQVSTSANGGHLAAAFNRSQDLLFEQRFGEGQRERLSEAARELMRLKVGLTLPLSLLPRADEVIE